MSKPLATKVSTPLSENVEIALCILNTLTATIIIQVVKEKAT